MGVGEDGPVRSACWARGAGLEFMREAGIKWWWFWPLFDGFGLTGLVDLTERVASNHLI